MAGELVRHAGRVEDLAQAVLDPQAGGADRVEHVGVADDLERLRRGRGGNPVARVRAAVAHLVGQQAHDLGASAERGRRIAVAHRLGVRREVGRDPEELGGAATREAEAGLHLVEDQEDPELLGERAHRLVEAGRRHDPLRVAEDRLDDDRRDVVALALEQPAQEVDVVVAGRDDRVGHRVRNAAAPGEAYRVVLVAELAHVIRRDADQRVVVDPVVLTLELHDLVAPGVRPRHAHRVHRRLGAGHRHARLVDPAGQLAQELDRADLVLGRERERHALAHALVDVVVDARVAVAEDHRAIAHAQVDVLVAVDVPDETALAAVDVDGVLAPRPEVRVRAPRQDLRRATVRLELAGSVQRRSGGEGGLGGHEFSVGRTPRIAGPARWVGRQSHTAGRRAAILPHGRTARQREYRTRSPSRRSNYARNDGISAEIRAIRSGMVGRRSAGAPDVHGQAPGIFTRSSWPPSRSNVTGRSPSMPSSLSRISDPA